MSSFRPKYQRKNLTNFALEWVGQNLSNFFVGILVETMTPKGHFEINWPLRWIEKHNLNSQPCNISWPRRSTLFPQSIIGMRFSETSCKINNHSIYSRTVCSQLLFSTFWYIWVIPGWSGQKSSLRCMIKTAHKPV